MDNLSEHTEHLKGCACHGSGPSAAFSAYFAESALITNATVEELLALCETDADRAKVKALGFVRNAYEETAGTLTFAERKVNLASIDRTFASMEDTFLAQVRALVGDKRKDYLAKLEKAVRARDYAAIAALQPDLGGDVSKKYAEAMKQLFETGKKTASDEMGVKSPETSKDISGLYRAQSEAMESKIATEMRVTAQSEALYNMARGATAEFTLEQIDRALNKKLGAIVTASGTQAMGGAFNTGRLAVFDRYPEKIYGFQYTAVIDRRTTNLCLSLNGRVIAPNDPDFFRLAPPNHTNCRSFWVEILKDEFIKPAIEPIPDSIPRERTGLSNFQDLQKIIPYKPKAAPTPEEARTQRAGVLRQLVIDLRKNGIGLKDVPEDTAK